ncbi:tRNA pseudouridine(55) synthase TruB [Rappaport israeli]|uniref:tRNA pseudouridine(55) synthase TruB n=1 Tax=Rappaport israeli TaxID=1839807 RepID=UPI000931944B|nr:tRNA pseudouridine(55) synthase TruB [Rappaport israeli]
MTHRKKVERAIDGVLLLYKIEGQTSNMALQQVRRLYQAKKAGHGGTLDPFAEGVLPILFGEASKFGQYILGEDKSYRVVARFGYETDSDDKEGMPTLEAAVPDWQQVDWQSLLAQFTGEILQSPPIYSALKVNGKRAYALAREGRIESLPPRKVLVHFFQFIERDGDCVVFEVRCSKGTYIRALVRDVARALGSAAHAVALTRLAVGRLQAPCYRYDEIHEYDLTQLQALLLPVSQCVAGLSKVVVPENKVQFLIHGNDVAIDALDFIPKQGQRVALYDRDVFLGVGDWAQGRIYPKRLLKQDALH